MFWLHVEAVYIVPKLWPQQTLSSLFLRQSLPCEKNSYQVEDCKASQKVSYGKGTGCKHRVLCTKSYADHSTHHSLKIPNRDHACAHPRYICPRSLAWGHLSALGSCLESKDLSRELVLKKAAKQTTIHVQVT